MTEDIFLVKLAKGLEFYKSNLETTALRKIKQSSSVLHSSFKNIYNMCVDKKILSIDQYESETTVTEIQAPTSELFTETDRKIEMSKRIAKYGKQLDFLNTSFHFDVENMSLIEIKKISDLGNYIDWTHFSENSAKLITRTFASMMGPLKHGTDSMQLKVLKNDLNRLRDELGQFKEGLQVVAFYQKELYRSELRKRISFNGIINFHEDSKEDIVKNIKNMMVREMSDFPIFGNLIDQLIDEEKMAPKSWEDLLKKLSPHETQTVKTKTLNKNELLKIMQELGKASLLLNKILKKLDENSSIFHRKKRNFIERMAYMFSEVFNKNKTVTYEIEVFNAENTVKKKVSLEFNNFSSDLKNKAHKIYLESTPDSLKKMTELDDEKIISIINSAHDIFTRSFRTLNALDTYFKENASRYVKGDISGIKVELNGIKMTLSGTQKKRNEYISQKEEIEQLKKLGIKVEES